MNQIDLVKSRTGVTVGPDSGTSGEANWIPNLPDENPDQQQYHSITHTPTQRGLTGDM